MYTFHLSYKESIQTVQTVSFFLPQAAFHFQFGGPEDQSNPYSISNLRRAFYQIDHTILMAAQRQDWLTVHRWLLTKNLMSQVQNVYYQEQKLYHPEKIIALLAYSELKTFQDMF